MTSRIYRAKRLAGTPLIWFGRWRNADASDQERARLELNRYRRVARKAMNANAIDPHFYYRAQLDEASIVVDIGAFRGHVAQEFVDLYGCRVHAFEPNPSFFDDLAQRFADVPAVDTHPYGLGDRDATLVMQELGLGSTVYGDDDGSAPTVEVQIRDVATALDELGLERIDYVKINIEGAEYDLLQRMLETGWVDRSRYLLIQFHEWYDGAHLRRWKLRRALRRTHEQVWNFPWIYELWCAKDRPHPTFSRHERAIIHALVREQNAERAAARSADR